MVTEDMTSGRIRGLRPEQMGVVWMKDFIGMSMPPETTVADRSAGNFDTPKDCLLLPGYGLFWVRDLHRLSQKVLVAGCGAVI